MLVALRTHSANSLVDQTTHCVGRNTRETHKTFSREKPPGQTFFVRKTFQFFNDEFIEEAVLEVPVEPFPRVPANVAGLTALYLVQLFN